MERKLIVPPNPSRLIEGLRDTGYDFNTAIADIIDNSVAAGASQINVAVRMDFGGDISVFVADDGCGMTEAELVNAMTYGSTSREDPRSLGKFGLGLKTASTAFCRRLSVITRPKSSDTISKATWDLDHVAEVGQWELAISEPQADELDVLGKVTEGSGTVVVWEKVDRVLKSYQNPTGTAAKKALASVNHELTLHLAAVYQRYLEADDYRAEKIAVRLNGEPVEPWDPFCSTEGATELVADKTVDVELPSGELASFTIKAFVLPRPEDFATLGTAEARGAARLTNDMQGLYIYRENRLIHSGDWIGMYRNEPHFTLSRVEFSFDHRLDQAFNIDIKKSQILLNKDLYDWVRDQFLPAPRRAAEERYRRGQKAKVSSGAMDAHDPSNASIRSKEPGLEGASTRVIDGGRGEVEVSNKQGRLVLHIPVTPPTKPGEDFVQPVDSIDDGLLWEPCIINTNHGVRVNTNHPYYRKVYVPNYQSGVTIQGMDSLLWSLCAAELATVSNATKTHFVDLRYEVSRILRRLVEDLPEPDLDDLTSDD